MSVPVCPRDSYFFTAILIHKPPSEVLLSAPGVVGLLPACQEVPPQPPPALGWALPLLSGTEHAWDLGSPSGVGQAQGSGVWRVGYKCDHASYPPGCFPAGATGA